MTFYCANNNTNKILILPKLLSLLLIATLLLSNNCIAQNLSIKEIEINNKPTKITIVELHNTSYLTYIELSKLLELQINLGNGRLLLSGPKYELTFLRGSSFFKITHRKFEEIKQLHLPVIEINNIYYLPFPTTLTLLDSASLIKVQIEKKSIVKNNEKTTLNEQQIVNDEIIPDNLELIKSIHNKVKSNVNQQKESKLAFTSKEKIETNPSTFKNRPKSSTEPNSTKNNQMTEVKFENKIIETLELPQKETKNEHPGTQSVSAEAITIDNSEIKPQIDTKKMNGYKLPKDIKRKRLQKLLGQNDI